MSHPAEFRNRNIFLLSKKGYPGVYWPEHPTSNASGIAYVHRVVAFEHFGERVFESHVHHKNGDVWDWCIENLELLTASDHAKHHFGVEPMERPCGSCGASLQIKSERRKQQKKVFCNQLCVRKDRERIEWPSMALLLEMVAESGYEATGRKLGVSGKAVKKRILIRTRQQGSETLK